MASGATLIAVFGISLAIQACKPTPQPADPVAAPAKGKVRVIHPSGDSKDCIEMYGSCTPPPDRLCTSSAFVLSCGESGELPTSKETLRCECP